MSDIYKEKIIDHYKNPRNFGSLKNADVISKDVNTGCGDELEIQIKLDVDKIKEVKFNGIGCVISISSASMLTEFIKDKKISEIESLDREDILKILGINLSPVRLKCAMLPLSIIKNGIKNVPK